MKRYQLYSTIVSILLTLGTRNIIAANLTNQSTYNRFFSSIGVGYTWSRNATFTDGTNKGEPYLPLYGLPKYYSTGDFGSSPVYSIEMGYRFYPALIPSISLNYISSANFTGNANYKHSGASQPVSSSGHSFALMLNNKIDLFDVVKKLTHSNKTYYIHPVIGAGIGFSNNYNSSQVQYFPALNLNKANPNYPYAYTSLPSSNTVNFAYNIFGGLTFQIVKSTFLEVNYIYMHLGKMKTGSGTMIVYNHSCGKDKKNGKTYGKTCTYAINETQAKYKTQGVLVQITHLF